MDGLGERAQEDVKETINQIITGNFSKKRSDDDDDSPGKVRPRRYDAVL